MPHQPRTLDVPDAWACVIGFLDAKTAVRARLVSRTVLDAFDLACLRGPADAAKIEPRFFGVFSTKTAERVCRAVRVYERAGGKGAPLWLRYIPSGELLAMLAWGGCADACDGLAMPPFSLGPDDARSGGDNRALLVAALNGHVAVLDRLALPPYSLGQKDAMVYDRAPLRYAAKNRHAAVLHRLSLPPYSLSQ